MSQSEPIQGEVSSDQQLFQQDSLHPEQQGEPASRLPLSALLSQTLVAFTIEFDNEFEHLMPHRTTWGPAASSRRGPWLVSQVMWANFMQFVSSDGVPLQEIEGLARITNLKGLERWGYIVLEPGLADNHTKTSRSNQLVRPTRTGQKAQAIWRSLANAIEDRWQARFGTARIARLQASLQALNTQFHDELPPYLPVVWNSKTEIPDLKGRVRTAEMVSAGQLDLSVLLARVLLTFALDFERESSIPLPISANTLRVLDEQGVRVRDLPRLAGISKEATSMALGLLEKHRSLVIERDPTASRTKLARLTPRGRLAQNAYHRLSSAIEDRWQARFGKKPVLDLREELESLVGIPTAQLSPLFKGLEPYPESWRAAIRRPDTLPHYPMVLHRGGFPDGS